MDEIWKQYRVLDDLISAARQNPDVPFVKMLQEQLAIRHAIENIEQLMAIGESLRVRLRLVPQVAQDPVDQDLQEYDHVSQRNDEAGKKH